MSLGGHIRRCIFWRKHPELYKEYQIIKYINSTRTLETENLRKNRLESLLEYAVNFTQYYAHLKNNYRSLQDFPVINKMTIIENRERMTSKEFLGKKLHVMYTSGSTGIPFSLEQDPGKRLHLIAEIKATNDLVGYNSHERMLFILGDINKDPRRSHFSKRQQFRENIYRRSVALCDEDTMSYLTNFLIKHKIVAIHSSGSSLQPLIDYVLKKKIPSNKFSLKTIITGGEMIPEKMKLEAEEAFGAKCLLAVKYSNEEMGIFGINSGVGSPYVLNVANYAFEILNMNDDTPAPSGQMGRIVITDFFNHAVPIIRYDTGDLGVIRNEDGKWPVLITVDGKRRDLLFTPNDSMISGVTMTNLMKTAKNIKLWQFIQKDRDKYCLKVVPSGDQFPSKEDIHFFELQDLFGKDAKISIEFTDEIPTTKSQKRRYTVNLYKPQD